MTDSAASAMSGAARTFGPMMNQAVRLATQAAKMSRPARESGVERGSVIMKKVKTRSVPDESWWIGIAIGSPSHSARPNRIAANVPMKPNAMSSRFALESTSAAREEGDGHLGIQA